MSFRQYLNAWNHVHELRLCKGGLDHGTSAQVHFWLRLGG